MEEKLIPFGLKGVELGDEVLEVGPGFGATTRLLKEQVEHLAVVELEPKYCQRLRSEFGDQVTVVQGDATSLPFEDGRFSAVLCFTMLHHIPERSAQDRALAEAWRVLRADGVFAGTDSVGTGALFKLIHIGDTLLRIDPDELPSRLAQAGFVSAAVERGNGTFRFSARKPA